MNTHLTWLEFTQDLHGLVRWDERKSTRRAWIVLSFRNGGMVEVPWTSRSFSIIICSLPSSKGVQNPRKSRLYSFLFPKHPHAPVSFLLGNSIFTGRPNFFSFVFYFFFIEYSIYFKAQRAFRYKREMVNFPFPHSVKEVNKNKNII